MNLSATQNLIGNINVRRLLVVIVLLSFLLALGQNAEIMENENKVLSAGDNTPNSTYIIKQNYTPRVVVVLVQTHATEGWCRLMLSAIMNKIEIVTIALGALYSHERRPGWIMEYIESEVLNDEDIIISVDGSDTIVTERENFDRGVQYFINKSAPNESRFSPDDVAKEKQISPMIFLSDSNCYAPQLDVVIDSAHKEHVSRCHWFYKYAYDFVEKHSLTGLMGKLENGRNFLSAGAFIGRVWAYKKAHKAYNKVLSTSNKWWCDQSIWVLVFIWSVTQTNISSDLHALPTGLIGLDYDSKFFHYPLHSKSQAAAFLHFAGDPIAWKMDVTVIISQLTWYRNFSQESKQRKIFQDKVLEAILELHFFNTAERSVSFEAVCTKKFLTDTEKMFDTGK